MCNSIVYMRMVSSGEIPCKQNDSKTKRNATTKRRNKRIKYIKTKQKWQLSREEEEGVVTERVASAGYASSRRATAAQQEAQFIGSWLLWIGGAAELSPALSVYHFIKCVPAWRSVFHTLHTSLSPHSALHMLHTPLTLLVCQSHCWFSVFVFVCVFCLFELCRDAGPGRGEGVVLSRLRDAFHSYPVKYSHLSSSSARLALPCLTLPCQAPKATDEFC